MKGLRKITPYIPGAQPSKETIIKLNTNENPYPPSPQVTTALQQFNPESLKRYSSIDNHLLKQALAKQHDLTSQHFMIGNGSDEVLAFCFLAFFNSTDPILFPDLTYGFYKVWADLFRIPYRELPLTANFEIDLSLYHQVNGGIILANPNAPTGILKPLAEIQQLLQQNPEVIVIVDEAYADFAGVSALSLVKDYPNLVIIRTFSKVNALAGLRVGYAIGNPVYIQYIESVKASFNPYSVDLLAETLAIAAVNDSEYYQERTIQICQTRDWFIKKLAQHGFDSLPSQTNFILTSHPTVSAQQLSTYFLANDVYVRYFPSIDRLQNYLRISIGTKTEMAVVLQLIEKFKQANKTTENRFL